MVNVELSEIFKRRFKRLDKKFYSLPDELEVPLASLEADPKQGTDLGSGLYKIRLASESKGTGKSGGFRVISYYVEKMKEGDTLYLLSIYDKSEESTITKNDLLKLVKKLA